MKISAKTEYACIAMLDLAASHGRGAPVRIGEIAERHGIPSRFLVQILLQLKAAGLVVSTRGAAGGYQLSRAPHKITLWDAMNVIEGNEGAPTSSASPDSAAARVLQAAWKEVAGAEREMLDGVTFAELATRAKRQATNMYYI